MKTIQSISHTESFSDTRSLSYFRFYETDSPDDSTRDKELANHIQNRVEWSLWFEQKAKSLVCIYVDKDDPDLKSKEDKRGNRTK